MSQDPTQDVCPESPYGDTHHLVPAGPAEAREQRCRYCGKSRAELVDE